MWPISLTKDVTRETDGFVVFWVGFVLFPNRGNLIRCGIPVPCDFHQMWSDLFLPSLKESRCHSTNTGWLQRIFVKDFHNNPETFKNILYLFEISISINKIFNWIIKVVYSFLWHENAQVYLNSTWLVLGLSCIWLG